MPVIDISRFPPDKYITKYDSENNKVDIKKCVGIPMHD